MERTGETNARARLKEMEMQRDTIKEAMETSDVEMKSGEVVPEAAAGTSRKMENAWGLLSRARQLIAEGNPTLALQTVIFSSLYFTSALFKISGLLLSQYLILEFLLQEFFFTATKDFLVLVLVLTDQIHRSEK